MHVENMHQKLHLTAEYLYVITPILCYEEIQFQSQMKLSSCFNKNVYAFASHAYREWQKAMKNLNNELD